MVAEIWASVMSSFVDQLVALSIKVGLLHDQFCLPLQCFAQPLPRQGKIGRAFI